MAASPADLFEELIASQGLSAAFQPVITCHSGAIVGYEGLIRGPAESEFEFPAALFAEARRRNANAALEAACLRTITSAFNEAGLKGKLFINVSPEALKGGRLANDVAVGYLRKLGLGPERIVIEITENQPAAGVASLLTSLRRARNLGFEIAIDDLGEGYASLRVWSELQPDFVKIDRHFIDSVHLDPVRFQFVRAIKQLSDAFGTKVIAEGIELESEFRVVRQLGIGYGQGYWIGRPLREPALRGSDAMMATIAKCAEQSVDETRASPAFHASIGELAVAVEPAVPDALIESVYERFIGSAELFAVPVVDDGIAVGLLGREQVIAEYTRPYRREIYAKRGCTVLMDFKPLIVDAKSSIQDVGLLLTEGDSRHLGVGVIVTALGRYVGVVGGQAIIREIAQSQIRAARHANPLTLLPGNVPISERLQRYLDQNLKFAACYCDIDQFKAYNDNYGYQRGDDLIRHVAAQLVQICDPDDDFVGHIGGDDFFLVMRSTDWRRKCEQAVDSFGKSISQFISPEHFARGGYEAEDRRGNLVFHAIPSLSIGVVAVEPGVYSSQYQISEAATAAKKEAKKQRGGTVFVERRHA